MKTFNNLGFVRTICFATIFMTTILLSNAALGQNESGKSSDEAGIKVVIQSAYIDGIHNLGSIEAVRNGFHPGFNLLIKNKDNQLQELPIYTWIETTEKRKAENPDGPSEKTTVEFLNIDITGDAAVAKIDLFKTGKRIFTDYLMLYKFEDRWRIVGKIYYKHP